VQLNPALPPELGRIISKSLEKTREKRYQTAGQLAQDLKQLLRQLASSSNAALPTARLISRPKSAIPAALLLLFFAGTAFWFFHHSARIRWAREEALPKVSSLLEKDDALAAFQLAEQARRYIPHDPFFTKLDRDYISVASVQTTPSGADIFIKDYSDVKGEWLGTAQKDKRQVLFDSGHLPPRNGIIKETLDWLDLYLGPPK
jgi:hypothetical protein